MILTYIGWWRYYIVKIEKMMLAMSKKDSIIDKLRDGVARLKGGSATGARKDSEDTVDSNPDTIFSDGIDSMASLRTMNPLRLSLQRQTDQLEWMDHLTLPKPPQLNLHKVTHWEMMEHLIRQRLQGLKPQEHPAHSGMMKHLTWSRHSHLTLHKQLGL
jgi:hypothetical protein